MAALPKEERQLLVLTRFQRMKYQEVAEILDSTEGAIKVKVHRAIKKLKGIYFKLERL